MARNASRSYNALAWNAAITDERAAVVGVLLANFTAICEFAVSSSESEVQQYARAVLDVMLSADGIVRELTPKRHSGTDAQSLHGCKFLFV
jgi:hypothetical protein